jgi:two-component system NarL family sensor kinase
MAQSSDLINLLIFGTLGMLLLAGGIVLFIVVYQKKLIQQKSAMQAQELAFQQNLLKATVQAQEKTSERIARDLHDQVGGMLSSTRFQLALHMHQGDQPAEGLALVKGQIDETLEQVRKISHELIPPTLRKFGLSVALKKLVEKQSLPPEALRLHIQGYQDRLAPEAETHLYRFAQEALGNALKHAEASHIAIRLQTEPGQLKLSISDDGKGFALPDQHEGPRDSLGLLNMASRARLLGGSLDIQAQPGKGSEVSIAIPYPQKHEDKSLDRRRPQTFPAGADRPAEQPG